MPKPTTIHFTPEQMNLLQEHGIISDLCVNSEDIWTLDRIRAKHWLDDRRFKQTSPLPVPSPGHP